MDREGLVKELRIVLDDFLKVRGLDLVDLIHRYEGRDLILRVLVDRPKGGISLGDCAGLNRDLSALLDEKSILQDGYTLEVSSPGLDRPLETENDFSRCLNKRVRFFLNEFIDGKLEWDGIINNVGGKIVYIDVDKGIIQVPLDKINKAKQII